MSYFKQFLIESSYNLLQTFVIKAWGKLLYLDYLSLPEGSDESSNPELISLAKEYEAAEKTKDETKIDELDDWINEGCKMKNGKYLLSKKTIDIILSSAQHKAGKTFTLYRFDHKENKLKPNAWISMTRNSKGYSGNSTAYEIKPDDLIIDAHGLADDQEVIINTNILL